MKISGNYVVDSAAVKLNLCAVHDKLALFCSQSKINLL
jgi:hypothetical protein